MTLPGGSGPAERPSPVDAPSDAPASGDPASSDARLEVLLAAAEVGSIDWDIAKDRLARDERLCRIVGLDPASFDGRIATFYDAVLPGDLADVRAAMQRAMDTCGEYRAQFRVRHGDGAVRWVDARGRVLAGPGGGAARMLGVVRDSTELRLARDTVARTLGQMAEAFLALDDGWRVTYVNPAAAALIGIDRGTAPGQLLWDLWPALAAGGYVERCHVAVQRREPATFVMHDADAIRWHQLRVVPARDGVSLFATDVTAERGQAADLQRDLLPRAVGRRAGLTASARYLPATDATMLGGDWYELIPLSRDRVALVIGDVQGHNVHAASTMGQLRNGLRAYATEGNDPVATVSRGNRLMVELDPELFATCCLVELDLRAGQAQVVRAGHPPPLVRAADGHTRALHDVPVGMPLGVDADETYVAATFALAPGDTLVLLTDGLVEDSRTSMETGLSRVAGVMSRTSPGDLDAFADALVAGQDGAEHRPDDIAVLAVRHDGLDEVPRPPTTLLSVDRADPRAARNAREFIAGVLRGWDLDDLRETTVLLVSEVVTNALRHTEGSIELSMSRLPGRLRVEVADNMSVAPQRRGGEPLDEAGRGVPLLSGFSDRWGTAPRGRGKIVWFELEAG